MIRLRSLACAALALLALSSCHRRRPRYVVDVAAEGPAPAPAPAAAPPRVLHVTGAGRALSRVTTDPVEEVMPSISPAGNVVLFETRVFGDERAIVQQTIVGVDPETGTTRTLYTAPTSRSGTPAWLPDGSSFIYSSDSSGKPSLVKSLAAQPNAAMTVVIGGDAAPSPTHPSFSPDGKRMAFETLMRGKPTIAAIGVDGSRLTVLGEGKRPSWSPDGKRIIFTRVVNDYTQIFMVNADSGTNLVQVTSDLADNDNPAWSPSGRLVVFNSNRGWDRAGGARDAVWNLFAIKPDGTGLVQLTDGDSDSGAPCWGKDGWIYFHSNQAGGYDIWRLHPAGELEALGGKR